MKTDAFLAQLSKVKATGRGRWVACCPAHDDRNPSLSIAEGDDGRVLAHCFGGCDVASVAAAVGMKLSDLMPDAPIANHVKRTRIPALDVLKAMQFQATVVALAAADLAQGKKLTDAEKNKLFAIAGEFQEAIELAGGA